MNTMYRATPLVRRWSYPTVRTCVCTAVAVLSVVSGCTAESDEVRPPDDGFYFPSALAVSPDESRVFVVNANSDLRFSSGSLVVIDADMVNDAADAWTAGLVTGDLVVPSGCEQDLLLRQTLQCEVDFGAIPEASVRIGNFASAISVQELDNGLLRLFLPVRGDPSVTWMDFDPASDETDCGSNGSQVRCNDAHRLTQIEFEDDTDPFQLLPEPFGLFVDPVNEYAVVTHLSAGAVTLLNAPFDGSPPTLSDTAVGLFAANTFGRRGAVGVAARLPGTPESQLYVTSSTDSRIQTLNVVRPEPGGRPRIAIGDFFFMQEVRPSDDGRGIAFGQNGDRAYVVNRDPPVLHIIDTSKGIEGSPVNEFIAGVEICAEAANLEVVETGVGERVYVACFREGQVWSIDPEGAVVDAVIDVGFGPQALVGLPGHQKLFVANFLGNTVTVVDLTPGSIGENRIVMRLGIPGAN